MFVHKLNTIIILFEYCTVCFLSSYLTNVTSLMRFDQTEMNYLTAHFDEKAMNQDGDFNCLTAGE